MNPGLEQLKQQVERIAQQIDAPSGLLPTFGYSLDGAHPHVEGGDAQPFSYVIVERGQEVSRVVAKDMDDLLYRIFADISFSMAVTYELQHRRGEQDPRRQLFAKQESLLGRLQPHWGARRAEEHRLILLQYPYNDQV